MVQEVNELVLDKVGPSSTSSTIYSCQRIVRSGDPKNKTRKSSRTSLGMIKTPIPIKDKDKIYYGMSRGK